MTRKQLYLLVAVLCIAGYSWIILHLAVPGKMAHSDACVFKRVTGIPCPSCGSTHAVMELLALHPARAFYLNPFGFFIAAALLILPAWLLYDAVKRKYTFYSFYSTAEMFLRRPPVSVSLILVVVINWAWNIYKSVL